MDQSQVSYIFGKAFDGLKPDEFGRTITTIKAPRTWYKPDPDAAKTRGDILKDGKFDIRNSLVKGDGMLAAPRFVCFSSEKAKWEFVVKNPHLYTPEYVKSCENNLTVRSFAPSPASSDCTCASLEVQAPHSQTPPSSTSAQDPEPTT